ncbi:hypothetical protein CALCODRAFT_480556 [Calocera cornea HHB12733]|uniref:SP-RING-type domain-containing protein n=1 Tax=Calocera cornea HHB12733 TaxID=1353952 RepID=A0A165IJS4_9BASI|nr:hypothetical protein CALCODRAFT_480556 [Calocera cornea HHB12733]
MAPRSQRPAAARSSQAGPSRTRTRTRTHSHSHRDSADEAEAEADPPLPQALQPFSRAGWADRPVDPSSERQVKSFLVNWSMPAGDAEEKATGLLADTARALQEAGGDDELAAQLETSIRRMIDAQNLIRAHTDTLDGLRKQLQARKELSNIAEMYAEGVEERYAVYEGKTTRQKYAKEQSYSAFREGVWAGQEGDDNAMPPDFLAKELEREEGDDGGSDEDEIAVGGQTQLLKCPLTLRFLTSCLTSKKCHHSYSREAILDYLRAGNINCPAHGCDQQVAREDLEENKKLERDARRAEQREREADQGLDEEPVEDVDDSMVL